ncbi:MAG TPA: hypothetical protein VFC37_23740, partial [Terracidiphilus sp.]|nr:hypothetical protein [Terracidiphilus sp.]
PEDLARARQVPTSTRELARRAGTSSARATTRHNEAIAFELERAAMQGSQTILSWLNEEDVAFGDRGLIVGQAREHLDKTDQGAADEQEAVLRSMLFDEVARQSRPGQIKTDRDHFVPWSALRLALWTLRRIPDRQGRARAFELALGDLSIP